MVLKSAVAAVICIGFLLTVTRPGPTNIVPTSSSSSIFPRSCCRRSGSGRKPNSPHSDRGEIGSCGSRSGCVGVAETSGAAHVAKPKLPRLS